MTEEKILIDTKDTIIKVVFVEKPAEDNYFTFQVFLSNQRLGDILQFSITTDQAKELSEFLLTKQMDNTL